MKKKLFIATCFIAICSSFLAYKIDQKSIQKKLSILANANIEALGQIESGGATTGVKCYSTYNSCWFWNCEKIWRCSINQCYESSVTINQMRELVIKS